MYMSYWKTFTLPFKKNINLFFWGWPVDRERVTSARARSRRMRAAKRPQRPHARPHPRYSRQSPLRLPPTTFLLKAGSKLCDYRPTMFHRPVKALTATNLALKKHISIISSNTACASFWHCVTYQSYHWSYQYMEVPQYT